MKKIFNSKNAIAIAFLLTPFLNIAQSNNDIIKSAQEHMLENYIFLDKAKEVNEHLDQLMKEKYFDSYTVPEDLAKVITEQMRKITKDKHLRVNPPRQRQPEDNVKASFFENLPRYRAPMFNEFKYFENNVGYLDMRYFGGDSASYDKIDVVMQQLALADAFIIDMRYNGGGSPSTVQYLCSYFFDEHFLLNTIYSRFDDHTEELWTVEVKGKKLPKVPVYILTSQRTFSGAEDFSYTMQNHRQRATIIGEITGGGAHPTRGFPLVNGFSIGIPFARTINPITKTNWEGVGVIPDVIVSDEEALEKAKEMAIAGATAYKNSIFVPLETVLNTLENKKNSKEDEGNIFKLLEEAVQINMFDENDINLLGYNYLLGKKTNAALVIFKSNTLLFPNSANVFDSYAEALGNDGKNDLAVTNYKKAIAVATAQNHVFLEDFQQNLKSFQERSK